MSKEEEGKEQENNDGIAFVRKIPAHMREMLKRKLRKLKFKYT